MFSQIIPRCGVIDIKFRVNRLQGGKTMVPRISIEDRLTIFAESGMVNGFTLNIWKAKAKKLMQEGIKLENPQPTGKKGLTKYGIDFSDPIPGTLSERLFMMAMENGYNPDQVPTPYSF